MNAIEIRNVYWEPLALYQKANTKSLAQLALLGYMATDGHLRDPIYGGAFTLLSEFESHSGIPIITTKVDDDTTTQIHKIANDAILGVYDEFALTPREIRDRICRLQSKGKGGK